MGECRNRSPKCPKWFSEGQVLEDWEEKRNGSSQFLLLHCFAVALDKLKMCWKKKTLNIRPSTLTQALTRHFTMPNCANGRRWFRGSRQALVLQTRHTFFPLWLAGRQDYSLHHTALRMHFSRRPSLETMARDLSMSPTFSRETTSKLFLLSPSPGEDKAFKIQV